jgi:hypothetical protein
MNNFHELHSSLHVFDLGPENEAGDPVEPVEGGERLNWPPGAIVKAL